MDKSNGFFVFSSYFSKIIAKPLYNGFFLYLCTFKRNMKRPLFLLLVGLLFFGCSHQEKDTQVLHREFYNTEWERFDYVFANVDVKEPTTFDLSLSISFTDDYVGDYFEMVFTILDANGDRYRAKGYKFNLKDADGQWKSQLANGCYTFELPINKELRITETGTYRFQIEYRMPKTPIFGVKEMTLIDNH